MSHVPTEAEEVKIPVPWGHIAGKVYGQMNERKILMVHGILDNAGSHDRLLQHLPAQYHYVNIDLPGHGLSSAFPSGMPLNFLDYVYSISLVLDALQWKKCIYIGHSLGAQIGVYFSILYPGRIEKLVAIDGIIPYVVHDIVPFVQEMYKLNVYAKESTRLYTKDEVMYALKCKRQEALTTEAAEAMFPRAVTKVGDLYKLNRDTRLRNGVRPIFTIQQYSEILSKFDTPVLIIVADSSTRVNLLLGMLDLIKKVVTKSNFSVVIVRGNHDVHNNYPERVAPHICKFLNNDLQSKL